MASSLMLEELLLNHEFHIIDVDVKPPFNPPFVLFPTAGFSAISSPSVSLETTKLVEGTSDYTHPIVTGKAAVEPITLSRGVTMFNTDFWKWISGTIAGKEDGSVGLNSNMSFVPSARRRNLLLMQSSGLSAEGVAQVISGGNPMERMKATSLMPLAGVAASFGYSASFMDSGVTDIGMIGVPARAYMLYGCIPRSYQSGSGFDAMGFGVSIESLEIEYKSFDLFAPMLIP